MRPRCLNGTIISLTIHKCLEKSLTLIANIFAYHERYTWLQRSQYKLYIISLHIYLYYVYILQTGEMYINVLSKIKDFIILHVCNFIHTCTQRNYMIKFHCLRKKSLRREIKFYRKCIFIEFWVLLLTIVFLSWNSESLCVLE